MVELTAEEAVRQARLASYDKTWEQILRDGQRELDIPEHERMTPKARSRRA